MVVFRKVYKTYDNGTKALKGIDLRIDDGEFVFFVGPSGSGKSTVVKLITAELKPTEGETLVNGFDSSKLRTSQIPALRRTLGVVYQDFRLIENMTVYENVAFAMRVIGESMSSIRKRVPIMLDLVGLSHKARRYPRELSGGEMQRVSIARALVNNPKIIIADEPTGNLDPARSSEIMDLLRYINDLGTTVITVTHEKDIVNSFAKRVIAFDGGKIVSDGNDGYYQV